WMGLVVLGLLLMSVWRWEDDVQTQRTVLLSGLVLLGWVNLWRALGDGEDGEPTGDHLLRWLPVAGLGIYLTIMYVPVAASFFQMTPLSAGRWAWVALTVAAAWGVMFVAGLGVGRAGRWRAGRTPPG